jgi:L-fuculose-phosphate aldolase
MDSKILADIIEVGRRMYMKGFAASNDGNISVRVGENEVIVTPTGVSKGFMEPDMLVKLDMEGKKVAGTLNPSSEVKLHLEVYKQRPDVKSVVHAHPPVATGFASAGIPLDEPLLPEVLITIGSIPIARYGTPSTMELPESIRDLILIHDAILLANHGALTIGEDPFSAYYKMETLEHCARVSLVARLLGGQKLLSEEDVKKLMDVKKRMNSSRKQ